MVCVGLVLTTLAHGLALGAGGGVTVPPPPPPPPRADETAGTARTAMRLNRARPLARDMASSVKGGGTEVLSATGSCTRNRTFVLGHSAPALRVEDDEHDRRALLRVERVAEVDRDLALLVDARDTRDPGDRGVAARELQAVPDRVADLGVKRPLDEGAAAAQVARAADLRLA